MGNEMVKLVRRTIPTAAFPAELEHRILGRIIPTPAFSAPE